MVEPTASPSSSAPAAAPAPAPRRSRWRRAGRALAWVFVSLLLVLAAALGGAWWWAGQSESLASLITRVARWLPEGQSLEAREVTGTLREGGHIGWLRWRGPTLSVEVENTDLGWQLQPLLQREFKVGKLHAQRLEITSTPDPDKGPTEPLQQLRLPLRIELPFEIEQLVWNGPPRAEVQQLQGKYRYDGQHHRLDVNRLDWADGSYRASVQLQADAPMQLQATLSGHLEAPLPDQERRQAIDAEVRIEGTLATEAARLQITADAQAPASAAGPVPSAHVTAVVRPWLGQPLEQANATFEQFDVASFWPAGPRTLLAGNLQAGPEADGAWALQTELRNAQAGPWDKQQLPLDRLQAQVRYAEGVWEVRESRAEIGSGQIALQGRFTPATQAVEGRADVTRLNPAALYSTLDAAPLQGRIEATTRDDKSVSFLAALQADGKRARRAGQRAPLAIERLNATGLWQAPVLRLSELDLQALQARVRSSRVEVDTQTLLVTTRAQAEVPGGKFDIDGQLGRSSGAGKADLAIASAPALLQWLRSLPGVSDPLAGASLEGQGQLALQWQGGWGALQQRLQAAAGQLPTAPSGLQLQARLDVPNLRYLRPGTDALAVQGLLLNVKGSPEQAQIELQGQARQGERSVQLSTALEAGLARAQRRTGRLAGAHHAAAGRRGAGQGVSRPLGAAAAVATDAAPDQPRPDRAHDAVRRQRQRAEHHAARALPGPVAHRMAGHHRPSPAARAPGHQDPGPAAGHTHRLGRRAGRAEPGRSAHARRPQRRPAPQRRLEHRHDRAATAGQRHARARRRRHPPGDRGWRHLDHRAQQRPLGRHRHRRGQRRCRRHAAARAGAEQPHARARPAGAPEPAGARR